MKKKCICLILLCLLSMLTIAMPAIAMTRELGTADEVIAQYSFMLDGVGCQLPSPLADFLEDGWSQTSPSGLTDVRRFDPHTYSSGSLYKGDKKLWGTICNPTDEELPLTECILVGLSFSLDEPMDFTMRNGLTIGSDFRQLAETYNLTEEELSTLAGKEFLRISFAEANDNSDLEVAGTARPGKNSIYFDFNQPVDGEDAKIERIELELFPK